MRNFTAEQLISTYEEFKCFYDFKNVEELKIYVKNEVLKEGIEASDLMINSLPNYLKIKIIIHYIDRREEV